MIFLSLASISNFLALAKTLVFKIDEKKERYDVSITLKVDERFNERVVVTENAITIDDEKSFTDDDG
jgi:hypothetical protein